MKQVRFILFALVIIALFAECNKESTSAAPATGAGGSTARFTIAGYYLYAVDHMSLKAYQINAREKPVLKSQQELGLNIETIFPYKDQLFIGSSSSMYIYSLADPASPAFVSKAEYTIRMACDPVVAREGVAYATLRATSNCGAGPSALVVYDINNASAPILKRTVELTSPYGLGMKEEALYVCEGGNGLKVFDISSVYDPVEVTGIYGGEFYDVIPYGDVLICQMSDGFALYDISANRLNPVFLSKILNQ